MPTAEASEIAAALDRRFPFATDLGIDNCRRKRDLQGNEKDDWSQHAFGNAVDRGHANPATLREMERWAQRQRARGALPIGRHSGAILLYEGNHLHIEGPERTGTPPCAGGAATPDVLNPPTEGGTAEVPVGPTPPGMEDREASLGPLDRVTATLDSIGVALSALTSRDTWLRALQALGGVALVVAGLVVVGKELAGAAL